MVKYMAVVVSCAERLTAKVFAVLCFYTLQFHQVESQRLATSSRLCILFRPQHPSAVQVYLKQDLWIGRIAHIVTTADHEYRHSANLKSRSSLPFTKRPELWAIKFHPEKTTNLSGLSLVRSSACLDPLPQKSTQENAESWLSRSTIARSFYCSRYVWHKMVLLC